MNFISILLIVNCVNYLALAHPNGAPLSACASMTPNHLNYVGKDHKLSDYKIFYSAANYMVGQEIEVKVNGTKAFNGILIQARYTPDGEPVGSWWAGIGFKKLDCNSKLGSAVTHGIRLSENSPNYEVSGLSWTPPSTASTDDVTFYVTIVQDVSTFFVKIPSTPISHLFKPTNNETTVASTTGASVTTKTVVPVTTESAGSITTKTPSSATSQGTVENTTGGSSSIFLNKMLIFAVTILIMFN